MNDANRQKYVGYNEMSHAKVVEVTVRANKFRDSVCRIDAHIAGMNVRVRELNLHEGTEEVQNGVVVKHTTDISSPSGI